MILQVILFLALFSGPVPENNSVNDQITFSGTVVEDKSGEPVTGAKVHIIELNKDFFTDFDGNFSIDKISPGNYSLTISFVSYQTTSYNNISVNKSSSPLFVYLK
jgi:hypothetical protein